MSKTIAVLLTCHNRREKTVRCLQSLSRCSLPKNYSLEVFLVDDGSSDDTSQAVTKEFPLVHIIAGNGQLYWNRGMHLAWETAAKSGNFDFYLWLNDDVELFPDAIVNLIETSSKEIEIAVGMMQARNEIKATYGGRDNKGNIISPAKEVQICRIFNGNLVLVPSKVFLQIGNLDSFFRHSMGDYDYAFRAKKKNINSYVAPNYSGYCDHNTTLPHWCVPEVPFFKRIKSLYSPLGNSHPYYYFKYTLRHYGIFIAIKHFFSIHLRLVYPRLWKK